MIDINESIFSIEKFTGEVELETFLIDDALGKYDYLFGSNIIYDPFYPWDIIPPQPVEFNPLVEISDSTSSTDFSETNVQVQGVDESDLIKTDGNYVYLVDGNNRVNIIDVNEKDDPTAISQVEVDGAYIEGIYLHDNGRMTVISTEFQSNYNSGGFDGFMYYPYYDSDPVVNLTVLDISNPQRVTILETTEIEGDLIETRALEDRVYVVTESSFGLERPLLFDENGEVVNDFTNYWYEPEIWEGEEEETYTYETEQEYVDRIQDQVLELSLPSYTVTDANEQIKSSGLLSEATEIYKPLEDEYSYDLQTVSVFDPTDDEIGISYSTAVPNDDSSWWETETVYMSTESLYLASESWGDENYITEVLKFDLHEDGNVDLTAKGEVPGYLLNQFSMDEYEDNLRIATTITDWDLWNPETNINPSWNNVYVLAAEGQDLNIIGETEDLAPGEEIFSVRFDGEVGYVVTFVQVDPLFAIDFSNPTNPEILSELKVPGFSEYLQIINVGGEKHLLGLGRDADEETGITGSLKLSLFDLGDLTQVTEIDNYIFPEDDYIYSPASWEYKALSYFPKWEVLALPFQSYSYQSESNIQGLRLFELDTETGITPLDDIVHDTTIQRSLRIGDYLVAFSDTQLTIHDFNNEFNLIGEVDLLETTQEAFWLLQNVFMATPITEEETSALSFSVKEAVNEVSNIVSSTPLDDYFDSTFPDDNGFIGDEQILFTGSGNDYVDVSQVGSNNRIDTGSGDDYIFTGTNNRIIAGSGNDLIFAGSGSGNNQISGGIGEDQFWLVEDTDNLVMNTISDFNVDDDVIGLMNTGLDYLNLGNDWDYTQNGNDVDISVFEQVVGKLLNTSANDLTSDNFDIY